MFTISNIFLYVIITCTSIQYTRDIHDVAEYTCLSLPSADGREEVNS